MKAILVVLATCVLGSCSTIHQMMPAQRAAQRRAAQLQELQLHVMQFADEYASRVTEATRRFQDTAPTPEERLVAQNWILHQAESVFLTASGPNPMTNALDMVVLATLSRKVLEDELATEPFGSRATGVLDVHRALEEKAWGLIAQVLTETQISQLREVIEEWRAQHPEVRAVGNVHFADFAASIGPPGPGATAGAGSLFSIRGLDPFSGLDPTVREIAQTRQLAERAIFYMQRAPSLVSLRLERFTNQLAVMPETKSVLASIDRASLVGSAADRLATSLPDILAKEREALISQSIRELNDQGGAISALNSDLRSTLQTGTETANAIHATLETLDRISARLPSRNTGTGSETDQRARPFDIREYADTIRELTTAAHELNTLTQNLDSALPRFGAATKGLTGDLERIQNRAFLQLLTLVAVAILGTFLAALTYRVLMNRMRTGSTG